VLSPAAFASLPEVDDDTPFEDLSDWLAPALRAGDERIRGHLLEQAEVIWEPVGTPAEYLAVNLSPPRLSYLAGRAFWAEGTRAVGRSADVIVGPGARIGNGVTLERCVVWEGEQVPDGTRARGGGFAHGRFYACEDREGDGRPAGFGG